MKLNRKIEVRSQPPEVSRNDSDGRISPGPRTVRSGFNLQPSTFNPQPGQRGIALVITLILLSVTLFMAIAFLAVSRRERGSVLTETDTVTARLAADSALASAQARILATVLQTTNPFNFGLLVSTNYINTNGFVNEGYVDPLNVSYIYASGNPLNGPDYLQNVANLLFLPRAPVFAYDRTTGSNDFRFYLDLNRNRTFDANGRVPDLDRLGLTNGFIHAIGDPEWIGVLERPDAPHGPNNKFLSRYAFFALPAGNTLDLNYIHDQANNPSKATMNSLGGDYLRNEGVGSWEINLAAFLYDLNTNTYAWGGAYTYDPLGSGTVSGNAFADALELYRFRLNGLRTGVFATDYAYNTAVLNSAFNLFGNAFNNDLIDGYSALPLMTGLQLSADLDSTYKNFPWPGANKENSFFDLPVDLFNTEKTSPTFVSRLNTAGATNSTYDRYTFYRMLAQLGTDSAPESGKLNLNYVNVDNSGNIIPDMETNSFAWQPTQFFTNAADRMLRAYTAKWFQAGPTNYLATYYGITNYNYFYTDAYGTRLNDINGLGLTNIPVFGFTNSIPVFGITNIPVWVNGRKVYTPAVNRLLQLAANIYDATGTNYHDNLTPSALPSVFRPYFNKAGTNVYIAGFTEVGDTRIAPNPLSQPYDVTNPDDLAKLIQGNNYVNLFGVPIIIGAKKGFPNFNEFAMQTGYQLTRKLQVTRGSPDASTDPVSSYKVNQMFTLGITNQLGVECWNSYSSNYTRPINIYVADYLSMALTNDEGFTFGGTVQLPGTSINPINVWQGYNASQPVSSFQIPLFTNFVSLPIAMYRFNNGSPFLTTNLSLPFEANVMINGSAYPQPSWSMSVTNNLQLAMVDVASGRIIDYVQLSGPNSTRNLTAEIRAEYDKGASPQGFNGLWLTNISNGMPAGIANQIGVGLGFYGLGSSLNGWNNQDAVQAYNEINGLRAFFHYGALPGYTSSKYTGKMGIDSTTNNIEVAYTATATTYEHVTWQANDPLIHYLASDLNTPTDNGADANYNWPGNLGVLNARYFPWGGNPLLKGADKNPYSLAIKDPQAVAVGASATSDDWNFPTNKFPTVGWLGRVHRGTPWQTVYLKASGVDMNVWTNWSGNRNLYDATNAIPTKDRLLFDLFTTALNGNATRGQLPINVGAADAGNPAAGLAAWSAVFSGIAVPTNRVGGYAVIDPAGVDGTNSPIGRMVANINNTRTYLTNTDGVVGVFEHVGDVLRSAQLTEQSPYLTPFFNSPLTNNFTDAMYEWLPQQTMSLLRLSDQPRFVIYSLGQTLTPAPNGVVNNGLYAGMITNYQVTAETVTRSVLRIEGAPTNTRAVIESYNLLPPD